jgi:hypothetical protein
VVPNILAENELADWHLVELTCLKLECVWPIVCRTNAFWPQEVELKKLKIDKNKNILWQKKRVWVDFLECVNARVKSSGSTK